MKTLLPLLFLAALAVAQGGGVQLPTPPTRVCYYDVGEVADGTHCGRPRPSDLLPLVEPLPPPMYGLLVSPTFCNPRDSKVGRALPLCGKSKRKRRDFHVGLSDPRKDTHGWDPQDSEIKVVANGYPGALDVPAIQVKRRVVVAVNHDCLVEGHPKPCRMDDPPRNAVYGYKTVWTCADTSRILLPDVAGKHWHCIKFGGTE